MGYRLYYILEKMLNQNGGLKELHYKCLTNKYCLNIMNMKSIK